MNLVNTVRGGVMDVYDSLWIKDKESRDKKKLKTSVYQEYIDRRPLLAEERKRIDDLYITNYGKRIPYGWHQFFSAHSGVFTPDYFPDYLLQAHFEHYMNFNVRYAYVFEDKNVLPYVAHSAGVRMPKTIISRTAGLLRDANNEAISFDNAVYRLQEAGRVFCKPSTISCGGRGCFLNDFSVNSDSSEIKTLFDEMGDNFVVQELLHCHPSIAALYPNSVNTFRVITYRWKGVFEHMPVFMRLGQGGAVVDNGAAGGLFVGITDDGQLTASGESIKETRILSHPDTGVVFEGYCIPNFREVIKVALRMHQMMPEIGLVYWDFTIDEIGRPVLIECNILNGTVYAIQMTHGVGPFGNRTPEILSWIRKLDSLPASKRPQYAFGEGV